MLRIAFALLVASATAAVAGEFTVKNCSLGAITISGFNENDEIRLFFSSSGTINHGQTGTVRCTTGSCKLQVSNGRLPDKLFGPYDRAQCVIAANDQYAVYPADQIEDCRAPRCP